jgi:cell surface protein SprA
VLENSAVRTKQHIYDPENFTFSQSYNKVERHDYEIEDYIDQQVHLDYAFSFQPKPIEPFKKTGS